MDSERQLEIGGFTLRRLRLPTGDVIKVTGPGGGFYCDGSTVMQVLWDHVDAQAERIEALEAQAALAGDESRHATATRPTERDRRGGTR